MNPEAQIAHKIKNVFVLRGVSGCGKSSVAEAICAGDENTVIVCADDFFTRQDGSYHFDASLLGRAHKNCRYLFDLALKNEDVRRIIVANTNTTEKEFSHYKTEAENLGHRVFCLVIENRHGNTDVHNVPEEAKESQKARLKNSISL